MPTELDYMEYASDVLAQAAYPTNGHHAITFVGTAQLDTAAKKWGTASVMFDGDSDYLSLADSTDWDICGSDSDDWTIDLWISLDAHDAVDMLVDQWEDGQNYWHFYHNHGTGLRFLVFSNNGTIIDTGDGGEITDSNWHHVALCKVGSEYGVYLDGTQVNYTNDASTDTFAGSLFIGAEDSAGGFQYWFDGHIDELRIIHSNIFTANPANAFGNGESPDTITTPTSEHQTNTDTKLLLHLDGADEAVATLDWSRCESRSESATIQQGTYSLEGFADGTDSLNDTLTRTVAPAIDLSGLDSIHFDIYSSRTGSNIKVGIHDSGGVTTEYTANISSANTWEGQTWDISGVADANKDDIDSIIITLTNVDADNTFYIDNMFGERAANALFFGCNF